MVVGIADAMMVGSVGWSANRSTGNINGRGSSVLTVYISCPVLRSSSCRVNQITVQQAGIGHYMAPGPLVCQPESCTRGPRVGPVLDRDPKSTDLAFAG